MEAGREELAPKFMADGSSGEKDCAWCKIMEQKICRKQYDVFDACMEREGEKGTQKCMDLFEDLRKCMSQKPSLVTMLKSMVT